MFVMALTVPPYELSGAEKRMTFDFADGPLAFLTVRIGMIAKRQIVATVDKEGETLRPVTLLSLGHADQAGKLELWLGEGHGAG
jgi:hypothetical protein